jgi:hypothetical protein
VFAKFAVFGAKGSEEVAVDIEFANYFAVDEDGDYDFGFGFERAGEVARVGVDVVDHDGFATGGGGSADALVEPWCPGMGPGRACWDRRTARACRSRPSCNALIFRGAG